MQLWSIFWHLRLLSDQPIVVSGIGIARFVPILVFALVGGLVADTFNRKTIVYITQAVMILVAALLGFLTASSRINLTMIYILVVLQGISIAFDGPARQSLVPNLVPREDLSSAFGLQSIATNVGAVIGPALSGWVIAYAGIQWTYWINAISFLAVIAALALMGPIENDAPRRIAGIVDRRYVPRLDFSEIPVGIQFILHQPVILSSMILDFFATFFSSANTLLPFVAQDVLHVDAVGYGWLAAAQSIGSVIVAFIMSQRKQILGQGKLLLRAVAGFGLATLMFGVSKNYFSDYGCPDPGGCFRYHQHCPAQHHPSTANPRLSARQDGQHQPDLFCRGTPVGRSGSWACGAGIRNAGSHHHWWDWRRSLGDRHYDALSPAQAVQWR